MKSTVRILGSLSVTPRMNDDTYELLYGLYETKRMQRLVQGFGVQGEFYTEGDGRKVLNFNAPPGTQPDLFCDWKPESDQESLVWSDLGRTNKFEDWLIYLTKVLRTRGHEVQGEVVWVIPSESGIPHSHGRLYAGLDGIFTDTAEVSYGPKHKLYSPPRFEKVVANLQTILEELKNETNPLASAQALRELAYEIEWREEPKIEAKSLQIEMKSNGFFLEDLRE